MKETPVREHEWLQKFVGKWKYSMDCMTGPDDPPCEMSGHETVRSIGGLWVVGEGENLTPDGGSPATIITLGFNPKTKRFVGSFVVSIMSHFWVYDGELDPDGKTLHLYADGPDFSGGPDLVKFRDSIAFLNDDHRTLTSSIQQPDGSWQLFMNADYQRTD
jgi:Protein of unknown function (DUF1579)